MLKSAPASPPIACDKLNTNQELRRLLENLGDEDFGRYKNVRRLLRAQLLNKSNLHVEFFLLTFRQRHRFPFSCTAFSKSGSR